MKNIILIGMPACGKKKNGIIISTGGGAVKKEKNMEIVKKNGIVIFLNRNLESIAKENHEARPLLKNLDNLKNLYNERIKLYHKYSDIIVENDDDMEVIINRIVMALKGKI